MPSAGKPLVYLAGFDVFRADAIEHGRALKALCDRHGLEGLYPFDNEVPEELMPEEAAAVICNANIAMIKGCDAVLANLNAFRGAEPDSGTAFEVGMAVALGKPVWAYFAANGALREQIAHDAAGFDGQGFQVEDFGLPRNLMLACTWAGSSETAEEAIGALAAHLAD
ncbi:nucleoside 2-deoxyribosyltransferase [Pseudomonas sp. KU26590]|uniref:nucleoside 2-deoxyribosyltransferase n=1 Tax=Pseudomonas sp. KU26590 TaxID=2991051 RepID=UPI00223E7FCB|nr:nucleoside 2-deoxyribosyltransferase [Pseudomonas sp. KU26590]UZJ62263.1 nucleoside 2-deoxyribosyltransferase [Pseudomonas sp. KU26590]